MSANLEAKKVLVEDIKNKIQSVSIYTEGGKLLILPGEMHNS